LRRRVAEQRKEASQNNLKEAEDLLIKLEEGLDKLAGKEADRKQAMVELSDLSEQVKDRRQKIDSVEEVRKQLEQRKQGQRGPAEELPRAVKQGNFKAAQRELKKLEDQLKQGDLAQQDLDQPAEQMEAIRDQVSKAVDA